MHRKPLTQLEAAALYRELKQLMAEDAERRQVASRFSADHQPSSDGGGNFPPPSGPVGKAREQAAAMIPGGTSYKTMEKIGHVQHVADDPDAPEALRELATTELARIEAGGPVDDVEAAIAKNVALQAQLEQEEAERLQSQIDRQDNLKSEQLERLDGIREAMAANTLRADEMEAEIDAEIAALQERLSRPSGREVEQGPAEQQEPDAQASDSSVPAIETTAHETPTVGEIGPAAQEATEDWEPEAQAARVDGPPTGPRFRSRLRSRKPRDDRSRAKLDAIAQLEKDYHGHEPDAEFEARATETHALGERFLKSHGQYLDPWFRKHIENRVAQTAERSSAFDERTALREERKRLAASRRPFDPAYDDAVDKNRRGLRFDDGYIERIETARRQGDYSSRAHERDEHAANEKRIAENHRRQRLADLEPADADAAQREARTAKAMANLRGDRQTSRSRARTRDDDGLGK